VISLTDEVERQVHFITAPIFLPEDKTGINNTWQYNRAPEGYLFQLVEVQISGNRGDVQQQGIVALFDGHEYTHWNIYPGVQSNEMLFRFNSIDYQVNASQNLHGWPCKEYTLGIRSYSVTKVFKCVVIIWYYLKKASRLELMEYAIKHPRNQDQFKRVLRGPTIEPTEVEP